MNRREGRGKAKSLAEHHRYIQEDSGIKFYYKTFWKTMVKPLIEDGLLISLSPKKRVDKEMDYREDLPLYVMVDRFEPTNVEANLSRFRDPNKWAPWPIPRIPDKWGKCNFIFVYSSETSGRMKLHTKAFENGKELTNPELMNHDDFQGRNFIPLDRFHEPNRGHWPGYFILPLKENNFYEVVISPTFYNIENDKSREQIEPFRFTWIPPKSNWMCVRRMREL